MRNSEIRESYMLNVYKRVYQRDKPTWYRTCEAQFLQAKVSKEWGEGVGLETWDSFKSVFSAVGCPRSLCPRFHPENFLGKLNQRRLKLRESRHRWLGWIASNKRIMCKSISFTVGMSPLFPHLGLIKSLFMAYTPNLPSHTPIHSIKIGRLFSKETI